MIVDISVDFPEPLGPKSTQVSPSLTVRLTPFRISLSPAQAWRSTTLSISVMSSPYTNGVKRLIFFNLMLGAV